MKFSVIVPTYNGGELWRQCAESISNQSLAPSTVYVIDSTSSDDTVAIAQAAGFDVTVIPSSKFNHGGTRNGGANHLSDSDFIIYLTQDAILESVDSFKNLLDYFNRDEKVAAVCGRQLPHTDANPLAIHARYFNYSSVGEIKSAQDVPRFGLKTAFMSNSFSVYKAEVFFELGCFPNNTILAEDMYLAAKMIQAGYKVAYCSEAAVRHSHNYSPWEEFRRYFDTGVFHACEPWIQQQLGGASGEGARFVKSELLYLWRHAPLWIPRALITTACKLIGYKLGKHYRKIPKAWRPKFSMYKSYWLQQDK